MSRPRRFARIIVVYVASLVITVAMLVWWIIAVLPYHWAVLTGGSVLLGLLIVGLTFQLAHALGERNYSRRQEEFVSNITHEMKSPLAAIKLHAQTLEQIAPDDEQQSVHFILQSVARMETLVDNVLESSRLIARKASYYQERIHEAGYPFFPGAVAGSPAAARTAAKHPRSSSPR